MPGENPNEQEKNPSAAPPAENKHPVSQPSDKGPDNEPLIPKSRFDEAIAKAREEAAEQRKKDLEEFQRMHEERMSNAAAALRGKANEAQEDPEVAALVDEFGVNANFTKKLLSIAERRAAEVSKKQLQPLAAANAETGYTAEWNRLVASNPEANDLSDEERANLKKMAFDKRYQNAPLEDVYKILTYGRPKPKVGPESSRGGARAPKGQDEGPPDFANMTNEEFQKYSDNLAKQGN